MHGHLAHGSALSGRGSSPGGRDPATLEERRLRDAEVSRVLWIVLFLNLLVAVLKLVVGFVVGALSMVADGFHSMLDASSNVVGLAGLRLARRAPDPGHPYGHRKFEALAAVAISLFLFLTCFEILSSLVGRLRGQQDIDVTPVAFVVMAVSIGVNILVTRYESRAGRRLRSMILTADARHTQSDVFASIGVVVSLIAAALGFPFVDLVVALGIAGFIAYSGYLIVQSSFSVLADSQVIDPDHVARIAAGVEGVSSAHRVRSRGLPDDIHVDLHLHVPPDMSVAAAHELAHQASERIRAEIEGVTDVVIHIEPDTDTHED